MNVAIDPGLSWLALFQIFHAVSRVDRFYPKDGRSGYDPSMVRDEKQIATLASYTVRNAAIRKASLFAPEVNRRAFRHAADDIHVSSLLEVLFCGGSAQQGTSRAESESDFSQGTSFSTRLRLSVSPFPV